MADMAKIHEQARASVERRRAASADIETRVAVVVDAMPSTMLRRVLRLYVEEVGYLGDHMPGERENTKRFACSGASYHRCSFSLAHQQGCEAIGGDGTLVDGYPEARSCAANCDESAPEETWCQVAGFGCPTCAMVDELLGVLAAIEMPS